MYDVKARQTRVGFYNENQAIPPRRSFRSRPRCTGRWKSASSSCVTSRESAAAIFLHAPKLTSIGIIRSADFCPTTTSWALPTRPVSPSRSGPGRSRRPAVLPVAGRRRDARDGLPSTYRRGNAAVGTLSARWWRSKLPASCRLSFQSRYWKRSSQVRSMVPPRRSPNFGRMVSTPRSARCSRPHWQKKPFCGGHRRAIRRHPSWRIGRHPIPRATRWGDCALRSTGERRQRPKHEPRSSGMVCVSLDDPVAGAVVESPGGASKRQAAALE